MLAPVRPVLCRVPLEVHRMGTVYANDLLSQWARMSNLARLEVALVHLELVRLRENRPGKRTSNQALDSSIGGPWSVRIGDRLSSS